MKPAKEWVMQLPPDVLEHPMPLPARLDYAEAIVKRIQEDAQAELKIALDESLKLQSHYAKLLNMHDGGKRQAFDDVQSWINRLRATGKLPRKP